MAKEPRGLGKGLGALLGDSTEISNLRKPVGYVNKEIVKPTTPKAPSADIVRIPIAMIVPNPYQPRMTFDNDALEELANSIKTLGLIQPITVRKISDTRYQIISGERRYRACQKTGMDMIPAYIRDASDQGMLEMAIVENIQRENLDPIEVAMSYQRLIDECSLTQDQMADRVGKKRTSVTNYLRLLKLPAKVQHDLKVGLLSVGHAKVILGVENEQAQEELCDLVINKDLSVRQLEEEVKNLLNSKKKKSITPASKKEQELPDSYKRMLEEVGRYFQDEISLKRNSKGSGSITIRFSSDKEVEEFLAALSTTNR